MRDHRKYSLLIVSMLCPRRPAKANAHTMPGVEKGLILRELEHANGEVGDYQNVVGALTRAPVVGWGSGIFIKFSRGPMAATDASSQPRSDSFTSLYPHTQAAGRLG